jgi:hypothetical protein
MPSIARNRLIKRMQRARLQRGDVSPPPSSPTTTLAPPLSPLTLHDNTSAQILLRQRLYGDFSLESKSQDHTGSPIWFRHVPFGLLFFRSKLKLQFEKPEIQRRRFRNWDCCNRLKAITRKGFSTKAIQRLQSGAQRCVDYIKKKKKKKKRS